MTLKCIIADDEPLALELMRMYADRHPSLEPAGAFTSPAEALHAIRADDGPALAFLDINMPGINGLELAAAAREAGVRIVFVTAHREYALDGFRLNALDYLLKPVSYEEFSEAVQRALNAIGTAAPASITVRSDYRQVRVDLADIMYVEGLKDYIKIYTASRERPLITQMSLKAVCAMLAEPAFVRVHRSYIVSTARVDAYDSTRATVSGIDVPVGETYRRHFVEIMNA